MSDLTKLIEEVENLKTKVGLAESITGIKELPPLQGTTISAEFKSNKSKNWAFVLERFGSTFLLLFITSIQAGVGVKQSALVASVSVVREIKSYFTDSGG